LFAAQANALTQWCDAERLPADAVFFYDWSRLTLSSRYPHWNWGICNPCWWALGYYLPDVIVSDRSLRDYYRSLGDAQVAADPQVREAREYNRLLHRDALAPFRACHTVRFPAGCAGFEGTVYLAPWARMANLLAPGRVAVLRSSLDHPGAPFGGGGEAAYGYPGPQYLEFALKEDPGPAPARYLVLGWDRPDRPAARLALKGWDGARWRTLATRDGAPTGPLAKAGVELLRLDRPLPGRRLRLECEGPAGEGLGLRHLRLFR
jgi:hypothetical protein